MGWQILSQLQGPQIDVNLYPNAAGAGSKTGMLVPSTIGAIGQGVSAGTKNYLDTYQGLQQIELNKQTIQQQKDRTAILDNQASPDMIQLDNDLKQAQLDTAQTNLSVAKATADSRIQTTLAVNKQKAAQAETEAQYWTQYNGLNSASTDPNISTDTMSDMYLNNPQQYGLVFQKNPTIQIDGLNRLAEKARKEGKHDLAQDALEKAWDLQSGVDYQNDLKKNKSKWEQSIDGATISPQMNQLNPEKYGLTPEEALRYGRLDEDGAFEKNGSMYATRNGQLIQKADFQPDSKKVDAMYNFAIPTGDGRWQIIGQLREQDIRELSGGMRAAQSLYGDSYRTKSSKNPYRKQAQQQAQEAPPAAGDGSLVARKQAATDPTVVGFDGAVKNAWPMLDQKSMKELKPTFDLLSKAITDYRGNISLRSNLIGMSSPIAAIGNTIATKVASDTYDKDPNMQAVAAEKMKQWNAAIESKSWLGVAWDVASKGASQAYAEDFGKTKYTDPKAFFIEQYKPGVYARLDDILQKYIQSNYYKTMRNLSRSNATANLLSQNPGR